MAFFELLKKAPFLGAFFVSAVLPLVAWAQCPLPDGLESVAVARVVDGDTVRLQDGRSVRLIGINAPELSGRGRSDEPFAQAARQRLQALVDESAGRLGLVSGDPARDRYGRTLAHLYDSRNRSLEALLLAEGLAYLIAYAPGDAWLQCLDEAERSARAGAQGLWRQPVVITPVAIRRSGFALVRGTVMAVERNRGGLWVELRGGLVAHIDRRRIDSFDEASLRRMLGRQVEVRGWIVDRSRNGGAVAQARWLLPVTHPQMIRLSSSD